MDIVLENVSKSFGEKKVIRSLSAVFPEGKITAVTAPSGRGKSTLMRLLLGLDTPSSGTIKGTDTDRAALFQEDRLFENLNAEQNVRCTAKRKISDGEIKRIFSALGIGGEEKTPAKVLSGGMARRVALARALMSDHKLLLMDEPFKGLDEENRQRLSDVVREYAKGETVIFFTHTEEEAGIMKPDKIISL